MFQCVFGGNVIEVLKEDPRFSKLVEAVGKSELTEELQGGILVKLDFKELHGTVSIFCENLCCKVAYWYKNITKFVRYIREFFIDMT